MTDSAKSKIERVSRVKFGIHRTLNTAKYESIVIVHEIDEEIKWTSAEERIQKMANWEKLFISEYKESHDRILKELGLSHKKAYFVQAEEKVDQRTEPGHKHELDDLDSLESLG